MQRVRTWLDAFGNDDDPNHSTPTSQSADTHALRFLASNPIFMSDSDQSRHDNSYALTHDTYIDEHGLYTDDDDDDAWINDSDFVSDTDDDEEVSTHKRVVAESGSSDDNNLLNAPSVSAGFIFNLLQHEGRPIPLRHQNAADNNVPRAPWPRLDLPFMEAPADFECPICLDGNMQWRSLYIPVAIIIII